MSSKVNVVTVGRQGVPGVAGPSGITFSEGAGGSSSGGFCDISLDSSTGCTAFLLAGGDQIRINAKPQPGQLYVVKVRGNTGSTLADVVAGSGIVVKKSGTLQSAFPISIGSTNHVLLGVFCDGTTTVNVFLLAPA